MAINSGTSWPRNGFTPIRRGPGQEDYVLRFPASCGAGNNPIGVGSAIACVGGIVVPATAGQDPAQAGWGVVVACYNSAGRPFTQQNVKIIASGQSGQVDVMYDPYMEFVVRCETSVGFGDMLKNVVLTDASAPNPSLPRIVQSVALPTSASVNDLFKFIRFATQVDILGAGLGGLLTTAPGAGSAIIVRWNRHVLGGPKTSGPN